MLVAIRGIADLKKYFLKESETFVNSSMQCCFCEASGNRFLNDLIPIFVDTIAIISSIN